MFTKGLLKIIVRCVIIGTLTTVVEFIACIFRKTMDSIDIGED